MGWNTLHFRDGRASTNYKVHIDAWLLDNEHILPRRHVRS